jgi:hypothetical protein
MDEAANTPKFSRFIKHIILGGLIGGVLSALPFLNWLNCLFCLLNLAAVVLALRMYLGANPADSISTGDSAGFGAAAGAVAGLVSCLITSLFGTGAAALASAMDSLPEEMRQIFAGAGIGTAAFGIVAIPVTMAVFAAFGALGGILGMQLFFKSRIRRR